MMLLMVGRSLIAFTVSTNESLVVWEPSSTVIVIVLVPLRFAAGVMTTVRLAPVPLRTIFPFGTSVVFEDVAETVRSATGVSTSPTVKGILLVGVSSFMDLSVMSLMVGRSLTATTVNSNGSVAAPEFASVTVIVMVVLPL